MKTSRKGEMELKVIWLGQAGLWFENDNIKIMVDPYLSDSVQKIQQNNYRRVEVKEELFDLEPDIMIFTHNHLDHYDPETVSKYLMKGNRITVLSPEGVWQEVRKSGGFHNYVLFNRHTEWTEAGVSFKAVLACHSDPFAIGFIIDDGMKKYYVTGDTLYNEDIFGDLPNDIDVVFLPVNGVGNNMNMIDASRFVAKCGAKKAVPIHFGMFDEINPLDFPGRNKVIPVIYEEIDL